MRFFGLECLYGALLLLNFRMGWTMKHVCGFPTVYIGDFQNLDIGLPPSPEHFAVPTLLNQTIFNPSSHIYHSKRPSKCSRL